MSVPVDNVPSMRRVVVLDIDYSSVEDVVGSASYARGLQYAQHKAVSRVRWESSKNALTGSVRGSRGERYSATAYFLRRGRTLEFDQGICSCPVGYNCKHTVALTLSA